MCCTNFVLYCVCVVLIICYTAFVFYLYVLWCVSFILSKWCSTCYLLSTCNTQCMLWWVYVVYVLCSVCVIPSMCYTQDELFTRWDKVFSWKSYVGRIIYNIWPTETTLLVPQSLSFISSWFSRPVL